MKAPEGDVRDWDDIDAWASKIARELSAIGGDLGADTRSAHVLPAEQNDEAPVLEMVQ